MNVEKYGYGNDDVLRYLIFSLFSLVGKHSHSTLSGAVMVYWYTQVHFNLG